MQTRRATTTQNTGQHIKGGRVGVIQRRSFPCQRDSAGWNGKSFARTAWTNLWRIYNDKRLTATTWKTGGGEISHDLARFIGQNIAGDDHETAVRSVAAAMV